MADAQETMNLENKTVSIIIPVLNESTGIARLLDYLGPLRAEASILLVDGGSEDETANVCRKRGFQTIQGSMGRAMQMNAGVESIKTDIYWFLHADCLPPPDALQDIITAINAGYVWGRFDVCLVGNRWIYRWIGRLMNWRSCLTAVATGDQGIFIRSDLFEKIGGYPHIPLMEDIAISKILRRYGRPACIHTAMEVSSRRWEKHGVFKTITLMWLLRLRYFLGDSPDRLQHIYYDKKK